MQALNLHSEQQPDVLKVSSGFLCLPAQYIFKLTLLLMPFDTIVSVSLMRGPRDYLYVCVVVGDGIFFPNSEPQVSLVKMVCTNIGP